MEFLGLILGAGKDENLQILEASVIYISGILKKQIWPFET